MAPGQKYIPTFSPTQNINSFIPNIKQPGGPKNTLRNPTIQHSDNTFTPNRNKQQYEILINTYKKNHTEQPLRRHLYLGTEIIGTSIQLESAMKQPSNPDSDKASQKY
jgi:hypothetical protein